MRKWSCISDNFIVKFHKILDKWNIFSKFGAKIQNSTWKNERTQKKTHNRKRKVKKWFKLECKKYIPTIVRTHNRVELTPKALNNVF